MAISEVQKVDYLWKKLAYGLSKTDINENKRATNESIASPLLLRGENVWAQSSGIPETIPTSSTGVVTVYPTSLPDETISDSSATLNRTWKTGLTDWISPEFGSTYLVKVYIHTAGQPGSAASSGTQVFGAGSGNNDEWFFDYQSGILHFIGTNLPPNISGKSIYVSGARYTGLKGVTVNGAPADFTTLNISGISTFIGNVQIDSLTNNRIAIVGSGSTIEDDANLTFDGNTLAVGVNFDVDGRTELDITNISETLNVVGISTFESDIDINASIDVDGRTELDITNISETLNVVGISTFESDIDINASIDVDGRTELDTTNISETLNVVGISTFESDIDINASIDVDGHTELDDVNVSTALTANNLIVTGSTLLSHSNSLKLQTTGIGVSVSNGVGLTATIAGPSNLIIDPGIVGDNTGVVRIKGDLFVDGTQTQINSTTIELADFIVGVATTATSDLLTDGAGIQIGSDNTFLYEFNGGTNPSLKSSENLNVASGKVYQIDQIERLSADTLSLGTGTTIHSPASNALTFGTNGTEKVRITSDGDVGIGSVIPAGKLDVVGHTELDSVNVSGLSTFASNVDLNADLDVDGRTELDTTNISETLNVVGISTFESDIDINASIDVDGRTELDITNISETLNVVGVATFASDIDINASIDVDGRTELDTTNISETLNVVGISTFASDVDLNADLDVDGRTELDITNISETLNVVGVSTFESDIDINASIDVDGRTELDITNISETLNVVGISTFASDVDLNADLDVDGRTELDITNIAETLNVVGVATFASDVDLNADLDVDGRTELDTTNISETLNVVGIATFENNIDADGDLDVDGRTELDITNISETLNVVGIATFASNVDLNADLDVDGRTELDTTNISETLNVVGVSTFVGLSTFQNGIYVTGVGTFVNNLDIDASVDIDGHTELDDLNVSGVSTFASNVDINADLDVDGRTELDITNISETLNVVGVSTFASDVDLNADLDVDGRTELDITNISETLNVVGLSTFESDMRVDGDLLVNGDAFFVGFVTFAAGADGNITIGQTDTDNVVFNADIASDIIPDVNQFYDIGSLSKQWKNVYSKDVKVSSLTQNRVVFAGVNGKLQTSGNLEFVDGSHLNVGASVTVTNNLDVDGRTELDTTNISETLNVVGISTFASDIDINASIDVDGHTELDDLNVSGVSTFASDVDINASIDVDGHTELDDLNVSGVSTFAGAIDANGDLDVDGRTELDTTNISETLNVVGISTFESDIDINASIDVDGHTELDNLNVSGVSTFISNVNLNSNLDVDGQTDLDILNVSATATFSSNIDANGNLDVDGITELDVLNVAETATFSSNIDANGDLDVDGHTELDDLNVSGVSTFASNVDLNADLDVDGRTELDTTNISETLNVVGIATFASSVDLNADLDVDGHTELDNLNISGVSTFVGVIDALSGPNKISFLYPDLASLPSASTYHGMFAHVHATGRAYYAHGGNWIELVNKDTNGDVSLSGNFNVDGHTELDDVNISGVATATAFHTGALGSAIRITSDTISGPSEIVIDPAGVGDNTGALRIKGDLFVDGTQTIINSTAIELADFIVGIATTATTNILADGAGIGIGTDKFFTFDNTNTAFKSTESLNLESGHTYKINGTDVLSATTIGSGVTNSSLTSLGTVSTGVWQGTPINDDYIDTIDNANKVSISALNIDGGTDIGAVLADGDLIIVDDGAYGTNRKADVVGITTYTFSKVSGDILINSSGAATIQPDSVALATDTTGDFVQSISGTANEVTVSVTSGENVQPQIGLPDDVIVTNSLKVGTGITAQGGIITATTFDGNATTSTTATNLLDGANIIGGTINDDRLPDLITSNIYVTSGISTFASVDLGNVNSTGIITATTFDGNINLDGNTITGNGSVNITGIITATSVEATDTVTTKILNVGTGGTVISANADTGTFAIGSATTSITATMNGGAIPSIGLVIALGG